MGCYIETCGGTFTIKAENLDKAYELLCELNKREDLKTGRQSPANQTKPPDSKSVADNPNKWFAWMPWNYDEVFHDAAAILEKLGFYVGRNSDGDIVELRYYFEKGGAEFWFLDAIAPVVEDGSCIAWRREDGAIYWYLFAGGTMYHAKQPID